MISIPFSGSKRYSYKNVKPIVEDGGYKTVYEVFGGSCVLSANLYNDGVVEKAVINDFDGLFDLYPQYLDYKDWIVEECLKAGIKPRKRARVNGKSVTTYYYDENGERVEIKNLLNVEDKMFLRNLIKNIPKKYWRLLSTGQNFTHSAVSSHEIIKLSDFTYFGSYLKTDKQRQFLKVINKLKPVSLDYNDFLNEYKSGFDKESILIIDPPYTGTYQNQYKTQFTERQTIELLKTLKDLQIDFIFFNHDPDTVKEWFKEVDLDYTTLKLTGKSNTTANHKRQDVMVYTKFDN